MMAARAWLVHPVTVLAVAVLLLNDHLLKPAFPGVVTGKLSDVAGLVAAPPVLAVLFAFVAGRLPARHTAAISVTATGLGFAAVKVSPVVADFASTVWSVLPGPSVILADPTDLIALPALALAWWVGHRPQQNRGQRTAVLIVLPMAVLAIAATSAPDFPDGVAVTVQDDLILVGQSNAYFKSGRDVRLWRASDDGGRTWRYLDSSEATETVGRLSMVEVTQREACAPEDRLRCYRAVPGHLRVEESGDGGRTWTVSWQVTDSQRHRLARAYPSLGNAEVYLSSNALAVQSVPGGHVVVVANGRDGYARRDVDGTWRRIGFGDTTVDGVLIAEEVAPLEPGPFPTLWREIALAVLAGLLAAAVGALRAIGRPTVGAVLSGVAVGLGATGMLLGALMGQARDDLIAGPFAVLMAFGGLVAAFGGTLAALIVAGGRQALSPGRMLLVAGIGVATTALGVAVFSGWLADRYTYRPAVLTALALSVAGVVAATLTARPAAPVAAAPVATAPVASLED